MTLCLTVLLALFIGACAMRLVIVFVWSCVLRGDGREVHRRVKPLDTSIRLLLFAFVVLYSATAVISGGESAFPPWSIASRYAPFLVIVVVALWLFGRYVRRFTPEEE